MKRKKNLKKNEYLNNFSRSILPTQWINDFKIKKFKNIIFIWNTVINMFELDGSECVPQSLVR